MADKNNLIAVIVDQAEVLANALLREEGDEILYGEEFEVAANELLDNIKELRKLCREMLDNIPDEELTVEQRRGLDNISE